MSALEDLDRTVPWSAIGELVGRAPAHGDLRSHGVQLLAGARLRELGLQVPDAIRTDEFNAAINALAVPAFCCSARARPMTAG